MITASHNPAADNGYKLYLSDGAQVIPPVDAEIEGRIADLGPLSAVRAANLDDPLIARHGDDVAAGLPGRDRRPARRRGGGWHAPDGCLHADARGGRRARCCARSSGPGSRRRTSWPHRASPTRTSRRWRSPTPRSPAPSTSRSPTRERKARTWCSPATRTETGWPSPSRTADGGWRQLKGDQVGALLGAFLLDRQTPAAQDRLVATTIVSSTLLSKIAAKAGARYEETLTGFKWIARAGDAATGRDVRLRVRGGARLRGRAGGSRQGRHRRGARRAGHDRRREGGRKVSQR